MVQLQCNSNLWVALHLVKGNKKCSNVPTTFPLLTWMSLDHKWLLLYSLFCSSHRQWTDAQMMSVLLPEERLFVALVPTAEPLLAVTFIRLQGPNADTHEDRKESRQKTKKIQDHWENLTNLRHEENTRTEWIPGAPGRIHRWKHIRGQGRQSQNGTVRPRRDVLGTKYKNELEKHSIISPNNWKASPTIKIWRNWKQRVPKNIWNRVTWALMGQIMTLTRIPVFYR